MIGYLKGAPLHLAPDRLLLDVQGVGYEVLIPLSTYYEVQRAEGPVALHVSTQVREDSITLFGFWTEREKQLFGLLIAVSGVGPKLAQAVLSGLPADDLVQALTQGDAVRLNRIPGIGKKTAARLILDLKEKVADLGGVPAPAGPAAPAPSADSDLISALIHLGYKRAAAQNAVQRIVRDHADAPFADQLRAALKLLSR